MNPLENGPRIDNQSEVPKKPDFSEKGTNVGYLNGDTFKALKKENSDFSNFGKKEIKDGIENNKENPSTRAEVLKNIDSRFESSLQTSVKKVSLDDLARQNLAGRKETPENIEEVKNLLREKYLKGEIDKLNTSKEFEKDGKKITQTEKENILSNNPKVKEVLGNIKDENLQNELLAIYGKDKLEAFSPILEQLKKDGKEIPESLEKFDELMKDKYAELYVNSMSGESEVSGDKELTTEDKEKLTKEARENMTPKSINTLTSKHSPISTAGVEGNIDSSLVGAGLLESVIDTLPEGKVKTMFNELKKYIGSPKTDEALNKFVTDNGGRAPKDGYYCRAFLNAGLSKMGVKANGSKLGMDALNLGKAVDPKDTLPGDVVVLNTGMKDTAGNPGAHVGFFVGWSENKKPIVLSGNSTGGMVTCKEYSTPIIGLRRVMGADEEKNISAAMNGNNSTEKKVA